MYKHILLPTDGSTLAMRGVKAGLALANKLGAKATAVYANPGIGVEFFQMDGPIPEELIDAETQRLRQVEKRYLDKVRAEAEKLGVACETVGVSNRLADEAIIATAKKYRCDLVVMASHGRSGIKAVLLGSVATRVLTHSKVPVLIWRL
jgi:nucleotide-binding universal stress UspA family protein